MIVHRDTFHIRTGKMMEAVDLVKQALTIAPPPGAVRIYTDFVGQSNTMAVETEYADLAEFETAYEAWFTNEKLADIGAEFNRIYSGQGHTEIWHVHN
jgi:hypothetical protein